MKPAMDSVTASPELTRRRTAADKRIALQVLFRFLPAVVTLQVWLYVMLYPRGIDRNIFHEVFYDYWPMTIAMVFGSVVAGSTPLGGGVIAFPVSVLVIELSPPEGRDLSVLVQSVGMSSATYVLLMYSRELLDFTLIACFVVAGSAGVMIGLAVAVSSFHITLTYTVGVLEFAIVYFYTNVLTPQRAESVGREEHSFVSSRRWGLVYCSMGCCAVAGGFITASIGSGSDMLLYCFGVYVWNKALPPRFRLQENALTASSVVSMAMLSVVTSVARALTAGFSNPTLYCWGATAWLVCFGAPLGSMLLTPRLVRYLRAVFYALAVLQFGFFAALRIQAHVGAWIAIASVLLCTVCGLALHYRASTWRSQAVRSSAHAQKERPESSSTTEVSTEPPRKYQVPSE